LEDNLLEAYLDPEKIKYIVIHCSDTPNTKIVNAGDIHKMHLKFGWHGIGYHKVILRSGEVCNGRPDYWVGAHAFGINHISLGVCLIGKNNFNKNQFKSLRKVILNWREKFPSAIIRGHKDAIKTKKTCPNFDVNKWLLTQKIKNV
jgi:N-acetylmuramoyl-L-alanine amidase